MFANTKAIHFDLDGTLIDSAPDLCDALNATLKHFGYDTHSLSTVRGWIGNGASTLLLRGIFATLSVEGRTPPENFDEMLRFFLLVYGDVATCKTTLYPHADTVLERLRTKGYTLTLITNKPQRFIEPILRKFSLESYFVSVIGGDTLAYKKPHPLPLQTMNDSIGITSEEAVMVGDSPNDVIAARKAGVHSVAILGGYAQKEALFKAQADRYVRDLAELGDLFLQKETV